MNNKELGFSVGRGGKDAAAACLIAIALAALAVPASASIDKAGWIKNASDQIEQNFPQVDAFMWFNNFKPPEPDWRVVPDPGAGDPPPAPDASWQKVINAYNAAWHNPSTGWSLQRGVYIDGAPADMDTDLHTWDRIQWFEHNVGQHDRIGWYQSLADEFPTADALKVLNHGSKPYIVWQPYDSSFPHETARNGPSRLDDIVGGDYDNRIQKWAEAVKALPGRVEISFGHEMNGDWFTWGFLGGHNGNTAEMYRDAFRYVVDKFNLWGADNVDWVWCVNASYQDDFSASFPGTAYVARMGMDGFNWNQPWLDPANNWDDWREFESIFGEWWPGAVSTYDVLTGLSSAPIIIGEFGTNTPEPATVAFLSLGGLALVRRRRT